MFSYRGRAVKDSKELILYDRNLKSKHKVRIVTKEMIKQFEDYLKDLKNYK